MILIFWMCSLRAYECLSQAPFLSVALGELWQHLLLIYFNICHYKRLHQTLVFIRLKLNVRAQLGPQGMFQNLFI